MAYFSLVTKLYNCHKDLNSDRLYLAECFGEGVIVGPDMKTGDLVLYIPQDGEIERWFGDKFKLFRKNEDGTSQGGYIESNGHVRAIKLRGNESSGIVIALDRVYEVFGDQKWQEGDRINSINGKEFCRKYIPTQKVRNNSGNNKTSYKGRKAEGIVYPEFSMHADTEQLAYNLDKFKPGDIINLSLKMHGCWIGDTKVRMADGKLKRITAIRVGEEVLGYNFETKKIVPTKVVHTFHNAPSTKWNRLKFSRNNIAGDKRGTQTSTWNHKYWVEEKQKWIMAQDLQVGETVSTLIPSPVLTSLQKEVALGSFLGDGCLIEFNGSTAEIQETKKKEHKEYLDYISNLTSGWFSIYQEKKSGYGSELIVSRTSRSADLFNYMNDCTTWNNSKNARRLKEGIIEKITPLSIALWYIGDGSLAHSETQEDRALLAICRYVDEEDQLIIKKCFEKFNIIPTFYKDTAGYPRIRFNLSEANKLFELIAKYLPPIMQYKLPEKYRNRFILTEENEAYIPDGWVLSPQTVLENTFLEEKHDEWDLETELHNYIVGLTIVHNTSSRHMKTYMEIPRGFFRKLFHMKPKTKPVYVCGTRRCVVTENSQGYYGNDEFRMKHHRKLEPYIEDNMEVYGEIVGYYGPNETNTIMPIADNSKMNDKEFIKQFGKRTVFSYGCEPGQSEFYVYRITSNNGEKEWTPEEITAWCDKNGIKHVPYISTFVFSTAEDLQGRINEYFEDLRDPIGETHIKEGVVVRVLNRPRWVAYKSKTYEFRMLEGLIKESSDIADMEEAQDIIEEEIKE